MQQVSGKVAVVTGAASGIGRGMAETFAHAGMKVVLADVEPAALEETAAALRQSGADVHTVVTDVSRVEQVEALAQQTLRTYKAVHVLCNNAGVTLHSRPSWKSTLDDWNWILGVNLMGAIHGIRAFLPIMIEQGGEAHIVNTSSLAAFVWNENTAYATTKGALVALSESLYLELKRANLKPKVSVLCPAYVNTKLEQSYRNRPESLADAGPVPSGRIAEVMREWVRKQFELGLSPRAIGAQVLRAIQEERFYVFTHADWMPLIEQRARRIQAGQNPEFPVRPGDEMLQQMLHDALRRDKV